MLLQIFGLKDCKDTNKAVRFFKERRIDFQYRDLAILGISKKELEHIKRFYPIEDLINVNGKRYKERNLKYISHDIETELMNDPLLFTTPIVRGDKFVTVGYCPEVWKNFL